MDVEEWNIEDWKLSMQADDGLVYTSFSVQPCWYSRCYVLALSVINSIIYIQLNKKISLAL